jgi:hypothetical protein
MTTQVGRPASRATPQRAGQLGITPSTCTPNALPHAPAGEEPLGAAALPHEAEGQDAQHGEHRGAPHRRAGQALH